MNKTLKRVVVSSLMIVGCVELTTQVEAENQSYNSTVTLTVPPGNLSLYSVQKDIDFGTIELNDKTQILKREASIGVSDFTDTFAGWNVSVAKKNKHWDNHLSLSIDNTQNILNSEFKPFSTQKAGKYNVMQEKDFQAILTVPSMVKADNYSSTLIWHLVQGPESH